MIHKIIVTITLLFGSLNTATASPNVSKILGPVDIISSDNLRDYNWEKTNYIFFYAIDGEDSTGGKLFYIPPKAVSAMIGLRKPVVRLLSSGNNMQYLYSSSYPSNPRIGVPLPSPTTLLQSDGLNGAELSVRRPEFDQTRLSKTLNEIVSTDILNPAVFIPTNKTYGYSQKTVYFVDEMATIKPLTYDLSRTVIFGSDKFRVVMLLGSNFSSLTMSFLDSPPLQLISVLRDQKLSLMWPSRLDIEPVHTSPRTYMKTYVLGPGFGPQSSEHKLMIDTAGIVDESMDPYFQLSSTHIAMLLFAANTKAEDDPYFFKLIITRMYMAIHSHIRQAMKTGQALLRDIIHLDADIHLIFRAFPILAFGGSQTSLYMESGSPLEQPEAKAWLEAAIEGASRTAINSRDARQRLRALTAAFAIQSGPHSKNVMMLAMESLTALHDAMIRGKIGHRNSTSSKLIFYAATTILNTPPKDEEMITRGRKTLLIVTSMCTFEQSERDDISVQEAYVSVTQKKLPFHVLDVYSPCAVALRADLTDVAHRIYASIDASASSVILAKLKEEESKLSGGGGIAEEYLERNAGTFIERWQMTTIMATRYFVPESHLCGSVAYENAILVLPMLGQYNSYIISRRTTGYGLIYRLDGVAVGNQLFLTYVTENSECGISEIGTVLAITLPRPNSFEGCIYCGCVLLRYDASGIVHHSVYIADEAMQRELVASINSTIPYFNPQKAGGTFGVTLLLFPNGTVVRVVAFDPERVLTLSVTYIMTAVVGLLITFSLVTLALWALSSRIKTLLASYNALDDEERLYDESTSKKRPFFTNDEKVTLHRENRSIDNELDDEILDHADKRKKTTDFGETLSGERDALLEATKTNETPRHKSRKKKLFGRFIENE